MFEPNLFDLQLVAEDLANRSGLPLHLAYEEAEQAMEASAAERREALLRAIGALEYEQEFIEDAIVIDPKKEAEETKPIEEMSLEELWPPEEELQAYMQAVQAANSRPGKEYQKNIIDRIDEWVDALYFYKEDTREETIQNLAWFREDMIKIFKLDEQIADAIIQRIVSEMFSVDAEYALVHNPHLSGEDRDLLIECMQIEEERSWEHQNPDFWEWAENFDRTPSRRFVSQTNFDHLVENQQASIRYLIDTYFKLDFHQAVIEEAKRRFAQAQTKEERISLLESIRGARTRIEKIRNEINLLRFGRKLKRLEVGDIELPKDWSSFKNHKFKSMPFPRLDAKTWVILANKVNAALGNKKLYEIRAA